VQQQLVPRSLIVLGKYKVSI